MLARDHRINGARPPDSVRSPTRTRTQHSHDGIRYAFVEFADDKVATAALIGGNNQMLKGRPITVALSNPPKKGDQSATSSAPRSDQGPVRPTSEFRPVPRALNRTRKRVGLGMTRVTSAGVAGKPPGESGAAQGGGVAADNTAAKKNNDFFASLFKK
jgi:RNA recognition motif-containing protein